MFQIIREGCPSGYGYVRDYQGNRIYYGPLSECEKCKKFLSKNMKKRRPVK